MQKSINIFSAILLRLFNLVSESSCAGLYGEPDFPEELLK
ncbi:MULTISPECIES: cyclic lactone autoinducer peptide [Clostridium]|nr:MULTISPECIES: cyclic lactone autoinducer peptide [Clostridium]MBN7577120.1 cyclic lactone autoinducer peptide [Clostridium beijerinckii]MBN7582026.1 cyclic lactone autoinducer peptide [Clostridium beijerinckii]MBN7586886.1 cyclic lactone autoinducer peptide [Clostridium beijerinckii]MBO0523088.1 cyclic lactone autoinducer peptide [Clostridium beijerinckii]MZK52383.1 cyclic lactone autoinducer peptide [Clostridium beijerinckii]